MDAPLKILHYKRLQSTNTTAYQLAQQGAPEWTTVVADVQTKGRGRGRNNRKSLKAGLWFSIILRPKVSGTRLPSLHFLAAVVTRADLEDATGLELNLKRPT